MMKKLILNQVIMNKEREVKNMSKDEMFNSTTNNELDENITIKRNLKVPFCFALDLIEFFSDSFFVKILSDEH